MPLSFPDEERIRTDLGQRLADHFDYARRLLDYWLTSEKDRAIEKSTLPPIVLRVLLAMHVRSCRQFRSVIELCRRGESVDASAIARSMFETALVVGFVVRPRFTPREFNRQGKVTKTIKVPGVSLTREFRATLYAAHHVFQPERFAAMHADRPGMKRHSRHVKRLFSNDSTARQYRTWIGPDWTKILMNHPYTYSGLTIANLARSLGRPYAGWYDHVYGFQSEHVHAADMSHHMQMDADLTAPQWHGTVEDVWRTLQAGIAMFYATIAKMSEHIEFGIAVNTALYAFHREYKKLVESE